MRARALGAALVLLCACASGPTKPLRFNDLRPVPAVFAQALVNNQKTGGLGIRVYNTGSLVTRGAAVSELKSWYSKARLDFPAFLIHHPKEGLILFDTGFSPEMATNPAKVMGRLRYFLVPFEVKPGQNIRAQMIMDGVNPEEIRWVVISHLHSDHAGMIDAFPRAKVVVDRREWSYWKEHPPSNGPNYSALEKRLNPDLPNLVATPPFGAFDHGLDFLGDGTVFLVDLAGHTAGNMGLWVNLDSGPVLLAGDAAWVTENYRDMVLPLKNHIHDIKGYWRRLYMLRATQEAISDLVIFPGHDLSPLKLKPRPDITRAEFAAHP